MSIRKKTPAEREHRRYIRLDSVFPVQFQLISPDGKSCLSDWLQGFTNNIGKGGICLSVHKLDAALAQYIKNKQARLSLSIEIPLSGKAVSATALIAWIREVPGQPNRYLIGLSYEQIDKNQNKRIMQYAWAKRLFVPAVFSIIFLLGAGFTVNSLVNIKLIKGNKALVEQLVNIVQESSIAKQEVKQLNKQRQDLELKIQAMQVRIHTLEGERAAKEGANGGYVKELSGMIEKLKQEKDILQQQLITVQNKQSMVTEDLLRLDKVKATLEKANIDKMYQWLKIHQNPRTGLVMSFEGDGDIQNWAFTYDQALALQAYANFSDIERSKKLLDFFYRKAKRTGKLFRNAYYVTDGSPVEYTVHSGPNIWLGIAIVQYTHKTKDSTYLKLAEDIAEAIIDLQLKDAHSGIPGGPGIEWHATEHNLDAYAFFNMLYKVTKKKQYRNARDKALAWLIEHTYDRGDIPIKRGEGDSTIATDTYAWSVAAVGPQKLEEIGMNPDRIMEFAEQNCGVEVSFKRPEGRTVKIRGFDFAPQRHVARGSVVSSEWTAQMILAFRIMSDFYYKKGMVAKGRTYQLKADTYLAELGNMVISSPSPSGQGESCLPYATQDYVDTGHGWLTPKGKLTGSVAGTAYAIFAYYKYNPLELSE